MEYEENKSNPPNSNESFEVWGGGFLSGVAGIVSALGVLHLYKKYSQTRDNLTGQHVQTKDLV